MSSSPKTVRPPAPFDSQFEKEQSTVRRRDEGAPITSSVRTPAPLEARTPNETMAARAARIDHKLGVATLVLRKLSPIDPRARLLGSAMLRRDETLLDAVLAQLQTELVGLLSEEWRPPR